VSQVFVVTATRDIPQFTPIQAEAVAVKPFPAAFAPEGTVAKVEDVVGKFAITNIVRDQLVLGSQVSNTRRTSNLSATIPPEKVAFWMPLPDLLAQSGGVQPGDHIDILLSVTLTPPGASSQSKGITTQTTLQNVEVFFVGSALNDVPPDSTAGNGVTPPPSARQAPKVVAFLVEPQDALLAKYVKDSGGTIDLVLRSREAQERVMTDAVTADTLVERFKFRVPERWGIAGR
jgi:Flp pilus assembly protein CpaB